MSDTVEKPTFDRKRLPIILLLLVLAAGSYIRVVELGTPSFRIDEVQHYHAAVSLNQGLGPLNPGGNEYTRGIDITRLVAILDQVVSPPELAARIPSAAFGVLALFLMATVGWVLGGPWVALWATILLAIYPEAIWQSRHVRFYTYQLSFALVGLAAGWLWFRTWDWGRQSNRGFWPWTWFAVAVLALLQALRIQVVTLSTILGWGLFLTIVAATFLLGKGGLLRSRLDRGTTTVILLASFVFLILGAYFGQEGLRGLAERALEIPEWYGSPGSPLTYYYALHGSFPLLVSLFPLAAGAVLLTRPWLGLYLLSWFAIPFVLHSLVFPFRQERFILTAIPAFLLIGAIGASMGCGALRRWIERFSLRTRSRLLRTRVLPAAAVAAVSLGALATTPAFNVARKLPDPASWPEIRRERWQASVGPIEALKGDFRIAFGSADPLSAHHYWGRVDFFIVGDVPHLLSTAAMEGSPVMTTPQAIIHGLDEDYDLVVLAVDRARIRAGRIDHDLLRVLEQEGTELCPQACGTLSVYAWDFRASSLRLSQERARW